MRRCSSRHEKTHTSSAWKSQGRVPRTTANLKAKAQKKMSRATRRPAQASPACGGSIPQSHRPVSSKPTNLSLRDAFASPITAYSTASPAVFGRTLVNGPLNPPATDRRSARTRPCTGSPSHPPNPRRKRKRTYTERPACARNAHAPHARNFPTCTPHLARLFGSLQYGQVSPNFCAQSFRIAEAPRRNYSSKT